MAPRWKTIALSVRNTAEVEAILRTIARDLREASRKAAVEAMAASFILAAHGCCRWSIRLEEAEDPDVITIATDYLDNDSIEAITECTSPSSNTGSEESSRPRLTTGKAD